MTGRATKEWVGRTPDSAVPPRVRLRIFERHNGVCHLSGRKIQAGEKWDLDHIVALCNGGEHRESNIAPALIDPHKVKTKADRTEKKIIDRKRKKHLGLASRKSRPMAGGRGDIWKKKIGGEVVRR